jgi:hypothetical protein
MASTYYFSVTDLIWFHDTENPTDPDPAPGVVTAETGQNDFTVEITLADESTETVKHVGAQQPDSVRWIELRDRDAGPIG